MSTAASERLPAGLERVLAAAARRMERNGLRAAGRIRLERLAPEEVTALSGLLGARWRAVPPGAPASVDLAALDAALRAAPAGRSLAEAAARAAGGPLVDRSAARAAAVEARERGWAALAEHPALGRHRALAEWLERERRSGTAARAGDGDPFPLLAAALDVIAELPAEPPQTLAAFAARCCGGDPHALDRGRPLDAAVCRALAHLDGERAPGAGAESRRDRYDRWGLACDELTSSALCVGLRPGGSHPLAAALRRASDLGEPRLITLRELREVDVLVCGPAVFSCENPAVVAAAADALGRDCPPLVCTAGWPSTAVVRLLRAVAAGGATLHLHGDMDSEGVRILQRLVDATGGRPWRMTAADHARHAGAGAPRVTATPVPAEIRHQALRELLHAIVASGRVVREELVLDDLLADLGSAALNGRR